MGQIETKAELVKELDECLNGKCLLNGSKSEEIVKNYNQYIISVLAQLSDDTKLPRYTSLYFKEKSISDFVINSNVSEMEERFKFIHHDLLEWRNVLNETAVNDIKASAIKNMRESKRHCFLVIVILLVIGAAAAGVLGILSSIKIVDGTIGNIISSIDCTLGILFFAWELYDDKVKESKINAGDEELIRKHISGEDAEIYNIIIAYGKGSQAAGRDAIKAKNVQIVNGYNNSIN